jgi:hypothetical protein
MPKREARSLDPSHYASLEAQLSAERLSQS